MYRWVPEKPLDDLWLLVEREANKKSSFERFPEAHLSVAKTPTLTVSFSGTEFDGTDALRQENSEKCKQHIPGVGELANVFALAWLGKTLKFSADCKVKEKILIPDIFGSVRETESKNILHLPCCCQICSAVGTAEVYGLAKELLIRHNSTVMARQAIYWGNMARECKIEEYTCWVKKALEQSGKSKMVLRYTAHQIIKADSLSKEGSTASADVIKLFGGNNTVLSMFRQ